MVFASLCCLSCRAPRSVVEAAAQERGFSTAEARGWVEEAKRGRGILDELTALSPAKVAKLPSSAHRGEEVAFIGTGMVEHDLYTLKGFYLRLVTPAGKDLRPEKCMWYEVLVRGKILAVYAKNRIIVIEVNENDWQVVQTG